jgi:hypothetical protein
VVDLVLKPGAFTCSVNIARLINADESKLFKGALVEDDLDAFKRTATIDMMKALSVLPENHPFALNRTADGRYLVTYYSRFGTYSDTADSSQ